MTDTLEKAALFKDPAHLLAALDVASSGKPYPPRLLFVPDRGWAVALQLLGKEEEVKRVSRQYTWGVDCPTGAIAGKWLPAHSVMTGRRSILLGRWFYLDPVSMTEWAAHTAAPIPESAQWAVSDPTRPHLQFILGARDEAGAQGILDAVSLRRGQGVIPLPELLDPNGPEASPCRYFWSVFLERPNPFLFEAADRVWWGPVVPGEVKIFFEYPWSLELDTRRLGRMPWTAETGIVLLNRNSPEVIELRRTGLGASQVDYLDSVELTGGAISASVPAVAPQQPPHHRFKVDIRLGDSDRFTPINVRIKALTQELKIKARTLKGLLDQSAEDRPFQPLFLYEQRDMGPERGQLPLEIQRLIVEWSERPDELGAVRYAHLPGEDLPAGLFREGAGVHVIVAAATIGEAGPDVSSRLLDYAPNALNSWSMMLEHDWAAARLCLFTPARNRILLYPNLQASDVTASALASAIHPDRGAERGDWIYLALPGRNEPLQFMLLRKCALQPLSRPVTGLLEIGAEVGAPEVRRIVGGKLLASVGEAVDAEMTKAVGREANARLDQVIGRLRDEVGALANQLPQRMSRADDARARARALDEQLDATRQFLSDSLDLSTKLEALLQPLIRESDVPDGSRSALLSVLDGYQGLVQKYEQRTKDFHRRWKKRQFE